MPISLNPIAALLEDLNPVSAFMKNPKHDDPPPQKKKSLSTEERWRAEELQRRRGK